MTQNKDSNAPKMPSADPVTNTLTQPPINQQEQASQEQIRRMKEEEEEERLRRKHEALLHQQNQGGGQSAQNSKSGGLNFGWEEFTMGAIVAALLLGPFGLALFATLWGAGYVAKKLVKNEKQGEYAAQPEEPHIQQASAAHTKATHNQEEAISPPRNTPGQRRGSNISMTP